MKSLFFLLSQVLFSKHTQEWSTLDSTLECVALPTVVHFGSGKQWQKQRPPSAICVQKRRWWRRVIHFSPLLSSLHGSPRMRTAPPAPLRCHKMAFKTAAVGGLEAMNEWQADCHHLNGREASGGIGGGGWRAEMLDGRQLEWHKGLVRRRIGGVIKQKLTNKIFFIFVDPNQVITDHIWWQN
jgi:hypothetical protein